MYIDEIFILLFFRHTMTPPLLREHLEIEQRPVKGIKKISGNVSDKVITGVLEVEDVFGALLDSTDSSKPTSGISHAVLRNTRIWQRRAQKIKSIKLI